MKPGRSKRMEEQIMENWAGGPARTDTGGAVGQDRGTAKAGAKAGAARGQEGGGDQTT